MHHNNQTMGLGCSVVHDAIEAVGKRELIHDATGDEIRVRVFGELAKFVESSPCHSHCCLR
jgi:hypothetical protein